MRRVIFPATFLAFVILATGDICVTHAGTPKLREEKRFAFEMRGVPWKKVLEWLSDQSGLPVVTKIPAPPGTFTFIAPMKNKTPVTYSLSEVIDLLNDALIRDGHLLVRRNSSITLVAQDENFDAALAVHVELDDLKSRGRTELVTIKLPLERFGDANTAREVQKLMGRFGQVVMLPEMKRVVLRDTVENLRRILTITARDNPPPKVDPDAVKQREEPKEVRKEANRNNDKRGAVAFLYVRLVAITNTTTGNQAMLLDLARSYDYVSLKASPGSARFKVRHIDDDDKIVLSGQVIRIDGREFYFQADDQVYRFAIGDNLGTALSKSLSDNELKELGLQRVTAR
jgi:hypothetical protein